MSAPDVLEGEVVDELPAKAEVVTATPRELAVVPEATADDLVKRLEVIRLAMEQSMKEGLDYGVVPGTSGKPSLFKPGAEKLTALFQLDIQVENEQQWDGNHLTVTSRATVFHAPTGTRLGHGEGLCSTREKKYATRRASRVCPSCGVAAIIKGKAEYGGGWVCFKKKDGCGAKYPDGDTAIEGQEVGEIENPDLPDTWNTVLKIGQKRARVDAVLAVTGASALFTQDVEDFVPNTPDPGPPPEPSTPPPPAVELIGDTAARELFAMANGIPRAEIAKIVTQNLSDAAQAKAGALDTDDAVIGAIGLMARQKLEGFRGWIETKAGESK